MVFNLVNYLSICYFLPFITCYFPDMNPGPLERQASAQTVMLCCSPVSVFKIIAKLLKLKSKCSSLATHIPKLVLALAPTWEKPHAIKFTLINLKGAS